MNPAVLLCHPQSFPTESYLGYILRLSEKNGYSSPRGLYHLAGVRVTRRKSGLNTAALARITRGSVTDLEAISYQPSRANSSRIHLLGHEIDVRRVPFNTARLCPQCVAEKGFIEAHWDLKLMTGCPDHHCRAAEVCPKCSKPLDRFETGLLECRCGGDISKSELAPISSDDISLLALIRSKILGTTLSGGEAPTHPYQDLLAMNLQLMLRVIEVIGKHRLAVDNRADANDSYQVVHAAANVLKDWPTNFHARLRDLGSGFSDDTRDGARFKLRILCDTLFTSKPQCCPPKQAALFRQAFVEFATKQWQNGLASKALITQLKRLDSDHLITVTEWAKRARVCVPAATKYLNLTGQRTSRPRFHDRVIGVVVGENDTIPSVAPGKILRLTEAAVRLAIPMWLLTALKKSELYENAYRGVVEFGFHERDLNTFQQKLLEMALGQRQVSWPRGQCVSLRTILSEKIKGISKKDKEKFVYRVLSGELLAVESVDGTVGGLLVRTADYDSFRKSYTARFHRDYFNKSEVTRSLKCARSIVGNLVDRGLLCGSRDNTEVDMDSVRRFSDKYVSLNSVAKDMKVNVRIILRYCEHKQVALLLPREDQPRTRSFISVVDCAILKARGLPSFLDDVARITPCYANRYRLKEAKPATLPRNLRRVLERHVSHESDSVVGRVA